MLFEINKTVNGVTRRETRGSISPVFVNTPDKVVRHTHVERSVSTTCQDVDVA